MLQNSLQYPRVIGSWGHCHQVQLFHIITMDPFDLEVINLVIEVP